VILEFFTSDNLNEFFVTSLAGLVVAVIGWVASRWWTRRHRDEPWPEVKLTIRSQVAGRFRFAEFLVANPFAEPIIVTEIGLRGWGSGERIAPALWQEGQAVAVPNFQFANGRTYSLQVQIRRSDDIRKWTPVKFFPWHINLPHGGIMRLAINLRIQQLPPRRATWIYKFDVLVPSVGANAAFDPFSVRRTWL
jgi:hypothetical protein